MGRDPPEFPDDNAKVVGSSHGWLALMNQRNNELFLSNPITRRHIKLPPIQSLPNPELTLEPGTGRALVSKLILSTPPTTSPAAPWCLSARTTASPTAAPTTATSGSPSATYSC